MLRRCSGARCLRNILCTGRLSAAALLGGGAAAESLKSRCLPARICLVDSSQSESSPVPTAAGQPLQPAGGGRCPATATVLIETEAVWLRLRSPPSWGFALLHYVVNRAGRRSAIINESVPGRI